MTSHRRRPSRAAAAPRRTAGALGAALTAMVGRIAERRETSEATTALIAEADNLRADFLRLVDR